MSGRVGGERETNADQRRIGQIVDGNYRITRYIASGGSSHVYEVEHLKLGKPFAMKLLRPDFAGRTTAERFRREAKAMARLNHEHVVLVVDCGELEDGVPYLVMELLHGSVLRNLLAGEPGLPVCRAVQIVVEACRGVAGVHAAGLIHRDLKPENLFVTRRSGGEDWCKILDFGVAKMESSLTTAQGAIVGTVRYMPPEQLTGDTAVGPGVDIYALGAILYECLSGRALFDGESVQEIMYRIMNREPVPLLELRPDLPPALAEAVMGAVSKQPEHRPRTANELERLLSSALSAGSADSAAVTISEGKLARSGGAESRLGSGALPRFLVVFAGAAGVAAGVTLGLRVPARFQGVVNACAAPAASIGGTSIPAPNPPSDEARATSSARVQPAPSTPSTPQAKRSPAATPKRTIERAPRRPAEAEEASQQAVSVGTFDDSNPYGD